MSFLPLRHAHRRAVPLLLVPLVAAVMAARPYRASHDATRTRAYPRLAAGRQSYRLIQKSTLQIEGMVSSPNGGATAERDIWFTYEAVPSDNGTLTVSMHVDSLFITTPASQHALVKESTGAGWRGVVDSTGRRVSGTLHVDVRKSEDSRSVDGLHLTPLAWMLPLLSPGAIDTLRLPGAVLGGGIKVSAEAARRCAAADDRSVRITAELRGKVPDGSQLNGRPVSLHSKGTMEGRWTLSAAGLIESADVSFRTTDDVMIGPAGLTRQDNTTFTLRRVP